MKSIRRPEAIFLNSPHKSHRGVATPEDLRAIADLVRGKNIAVFSDEPYCHMVWKGRHRSLLEQPGMLEQCVAAYTFSKSYSMSGWRLGFAVSSAEIADAIGKMINTCLSCVPPIVQLAGAAALRLDKLERDRVMQLFREKVVLLASGLNKIEGFRALDPTATFYVFPNVAPICNRLGITSHGLALYLLEGPTTNSVWPAWGECFGEAGAGFLRFARTERRLAAGPRFSAGRDFASRTSDAYLEKHPNTDAKPYPPRKSLCDSVSRRSARRSQVRKQKAKDDVKTIVAAFENPFCHPCSSGLNLGCYRKISVTSVFS